MTDHTESTSSARAIRRSLLRLRLLFSALGVVLISVGFILWLVTRSWFIVDRVEPILSRLTGGEVQIRHAVYEGDGRFVFDDMRVRAPGIGGPAGQISRVARAVVVVNVAKLMRGMVEVHDVELNEVLIRLSEDEQEAGSFNLSMLDPLWEENPAMLPPRISINKAVIEIGSHRGAVFTPSGMRAMSGSMTPADKDGWYDVTLVEVDDIGGVLEEGGLVVRGGWNVRTREHAFSLDNVEFNDRAYRMCPQIVRLWWKRMGLGGSVRNVRLHWSPEMDFEFVFTVDGVGLTLPIETADLWARYRDGRIDPSPSRPRMQVRTGELVLTRHSLRLENLEGELVSAAGEEDVVGVPYSVTLRIDELVEPDWEDKEAWMDEVLATAPFTMSFGAEEFRVSREDGAIAPAVELPAAIARTLEKFRLSDWVLSTHIEVSRGAPGRDADGRLVPQRIESKGHALITDASGEYEKFPYPLTDLSAYLEFDTDRVLIHSLTGRGSGDGTVFLSGSIEPPGRDAKIDLRLTARNVPVDEQLRDAMNDDQQRAFDALLHRPSYEQLVASGQLDADGPFALGGTVALDLKIQRERGPDHQTATFGRVDVQSIGVLFDRFPYPVTVQGGSLDWQPGGISVITDEEGVGLPIVTHGGGLGALRGSIELERTPEGKTLIRPDLEIAVTGDRVTDLLGDALPAPPAAEDAPEPRRDPGEWLQALEVEGVLDYAARVTGGGTGTLDYAIDLVLREGNASTGALLLELMEDEPAIDTDDWRLTDCVARLHATRDRVDLHEFTAAYQGGHLDVSGHADLRQSPPDVELDVELDDVRLGAHLLELVPARHVDAAWRAWERFKPVGALDGVVRHRRVGGESTTEVGLEPSSIALELEGQPLVLEREDGAIRITGDVVRLDRLVYDLRVAGRDEGRVAVGGWFGPPEVPGAPADGAVELDWVSGRFDSPVVPSLLRMAGIEAIETRYQVFQPHGEFNAALTWRPGAPDDERYELLVRPEQLDLRIRERTVTFELEPSSEVRFLPGRTELLNVHATNGAGRFDLEGTIDRAAGGEAIVTVNFEGRVMHPDVLSVLPLPVARALEGLQLEEHAPTRVEGFQMRVMPGADGRPARIAGDGHIHVSDASFRAGAKFESVHGPLAVSFERHGKAMPQLEIRARPERLRVFGQNLRGAEADLSLVEPGNRMRMTGLRADVGHGAITGTAMVGIEPGAPYEASFQLVAVPLADFLFAPPDVEAPPPPEGRLYATVDLKGRRGLPSTRVGRGTVRVMGEHLAGIPAALQIMQVFHASIPPEAWDYLETDFYVAGPHVVFSDLLLESTWSDISAHQLAGAGTLDLDTFHLQARFSSRGALALVRDVVGNIGDQIATIQIEGPLWDPDAKLVGPPSEADRARLDAAPPLVMHEP